jgi:hypothetical protein
MLSLLWPGPEPLVMAGRPIRAVPFRLRDLAGLEQWATRQAGTASAGLWAAVQIPDVNERRAELRRLYERAERGGVSFGRPEMGHWLATDAGRAEQLRLSLRVRDKRTGRLRRPSAGLCLRLARDAELDEWAEWAAVAWQSHPRDDAMRAIDAEIGVEWPTPRPRAGGPVEAGWESAVWAVMKATGMTFGDVGRMTLYQWDVCRSDGSPRKVSTVEPEKVPDGIDPAAFDREVLVKRAAFFDGGE